MGGRHRHALTQAPGSEAGRTGKHVSRLHGRCYSLRRDTQHGTTARLKDKYLCSRDME